MKRFRSLMTIAFLIPLLIPKTVWAIVETPLLIVEVQTRSNAASGAASQEFIEIYNISEDAVDLASWRLEYKSATGLTWAARGELTGVLQSGERYLLASNDYLTEVADTFFAAGLADSAGHLRLVSRQNAEAPYEIRDVLGWGVTADTPETAPAVSTEAGMSIQRKINDLGRYIDTDNNAEDFALNAVPTPESTTSITVPIPIAEPPAPEPPVVEVPEDDDTEVPITDVPLPVDEVPVPEEELIEPELSEPPVPVLLPLQITELLPNPMTPQTDNEDEYVEIYNPNPSAVDLSGYVIKTGTTLSYTYAFPDIELGPYEYYVLTSGQTPLSLANAAGRAQLFSPDGRVVAETSGYEDAPEGQAWALSNGTWGWTTTPTKAASNITTLPTPPVVVPKAATSTKKTPMPKKAAAAKPKVKAASTKTKKPAAAKPAKKSPAKQVASTESEPELADVPPAIHPLVLAGIGSLALVYAAYEYRQDVKNRFHQLRLHRAARRASRSQSGGR